MVGPLVWHLRCAIQPNEPSRLEEAFVSIKFLQPCHFTNLLFLKTVDLTSDSPYEDHT